MNRALVLAATLATLLSPAALAATDGAATGIDGATARASSQATAPRSEGAVERERQLFQESDVSLRIGCSRMARAPASDASRRLRACP